MIDKKTNNVEVFKYNLSFYYSSTLIYFIVFVVYVIVRGQFVGNIYKLVTDDPIIYVFGIIILIALISLIYNIYRKRNLEVTNEYIQYTDRAKTRRIETKNIEYIKFIREKGRKYKNFRLIFLKQKNKKRITIIRPFEYERAEILIKLFSGLKNKVEGRRADV
ncbi:MAG TPA: hypothetical protein VFF33_12435 [Ignavibacteriaceae bacterium]|nr:hypothetical protein [Ignavibacteriaceae bacterium]